MKKSYTSPDFKSHTVLTDDIFTYVEFYFANHKKAMKYKNSMDSKNKYGDSLKYHYSFYWNQALSFYNTAKNSTIESLPLASYYSMLNAVKAYLSFKCEFVEDFIEDFKGHGLNEGKNIEGNDLSNIQVCRKNKGVYTLFGKMLESNFDAIWPSGDKHPLSLKTRCTIWLLFIGHI
jgi:hypothetical protein